MMAFSPSRLLTKRFTTSTVGSDGQLLQSKIDKLIKDIRYLEGRTVSKRLFYSIAGTTIVGVCSFMRFETQKLNAHLTTLQDKVDTVAHQQASMLAEMKRLTGALQLRVEQKDGPQK